MGDENGMSKQKKVAIYTTCDQSQHMFDKNHIH